MTAAREGARPRRVALVVGLCFLAFVHVGWLALGTGPLSERELRGADSYNRLVQVTELAESGDWYRSIQPRSNTPYGELRVWSRAFDVVLWVGAEVLAPFVGLHDGLHIWAVLVGSMLHLLAIAALFWAVRPLLAGEAWIFLAVLLPFQVSVTAQFLPGRPDHHAAQALLFVLVWGFALRLVAGARGWPTMFLAALAAVGALWLSVEGLIVIALLLLVAGCLWLRGAMAARSLALLTATLAALSAVLLALERPPERWPVADFDRLSIVHCWLFVLVAGFWLLAWGLESRPGLLSTPSRRGLFLAVGAAFAAAVLWCTYPAFFGGPMVQVAPEVLDLWQHRINEFTPAVDPDSLAETAYLILVFIGLAPAVLLYLPRLAARAQAPARAGWIVTGAALALYLALALYQIRWGIYAQLLALPVLAHALSRMAPASTGGAAGRATIKATLLIAVAVGPLALGWSLHAPAAPRDGDAKARRCDLRALSEFLMRPQGLGDRPRRIMTSIFDGPELLYRTHHAVVATPDHRNDAAIADTVAFFAATDPERAHEIARRRGIDLVVFCAEAAERGYYRRPDPGGLLDRLLAGRAPAWLSPLALPAPIADYRVYRVVD